MTPIIVPTYAAIFVFVFIFISVRVAMLRGELRTPLGTGGHSRLERRMRVQGNFAEYVPLALLMLAFLEMQSHSRYLIHILAFALLIARIVHAYGVSQDKEDIRLRASAMVVTFTVFAVTAIVLLITGLRAIG